MKLKNYIKLLLLFVLIVPTLVFAQSGTQCNTDGVTIESIELDEKDDSITVLDVPHVEGKNIDLNLKLTEVGTEITYKIVVRNTTEEDYQVGNSNASTDYVLYTFTSDDSDNIVPAGGTKTVYLTVQYKNEVPDSAFNNGTFNDNKEVTLNLSTDGSGETGNDTGTGDDSGTTTPTTTDDTVKNPKTGTDATLLLIICVLFAGGVLFLIFNKSKVVKHLVIIVGVAILLPLTVQALCTCEINIESNVIIEKAPEVGAVESVQTIKDGVVTSGQGLYQDNTETNRFVFKGANPNNYIRLGNDLYRIMSIEPDNTLRVIRNESIGQLPFDAGYVPDIPNITGPNSTVGTRYGSSSNDLCYISTTNNYYGCKAWGGSNSTWKYVSNNASEIVTFPKYHESIMFNLPTSDAYLNVYLNGGTYQGNGMIGWYSTLTNDVKDYLIEGTYYFGLIGNVETQTLTEDTEQEKEYWTYNYVGIMNATDYVKASNKSVCTSVYSYANNPACYENSAQHNYLTMNNKSQWTATPVAISANHRVWAVNPDNSLAYSTNNEAQNEFEVRPVLFLTSGVKLTGNGTINSPYEIVGANLPPKNSGGK